MHSLSYSQNFLKDPLLVRSLVRLAFPQGAEFVVEIGAGKGIITEELARVARRVIAIEADATLAAALSRNFSHHPTVRVVAQDFLTWPLPCESYTVFSNIPFSITADILKKLFFGGRTPVQSYFIIQKEAAEKYAGVRNAETMVSILLKPWWDIRILQEVNRKEFFPRPNVDVVFAAFEQRHIPLVRTGSAQMFRDFITFGFTQWKSSVRDAFKNIFTFTQFKKIQKKIPVHERTPTELAIEQWIGLFKTFDQHVPSEKKQLVLGSEARLQHEQKKLNTSRTCSCWRGFRSD